MTQPAVTFQIRQLEEQFKARLFDRSHNRIDLTDAGRRAYQYATRIFELYDEMENSVRDVTGKVIGTLRIGAGAAAAQYIVTPLITQFQKHYPAVHIQMSVRQASRIVQMVENSDVDIGIIEDVVSSKHLKAMPFCDEQWTLVAAPSHPLAKENKVSTDILRKQSWIMLEEGASNREIVALYLKSLGLDIQTLQATMEISSLEAIKCAVEGSQSIAVLPTTAIEKELRLGDLVTLKGIEPFSKEVRFLYKEQKYPLVVVEKLLALAKEQQQSGLAGKKVVNLNNSTS
jgi:DNA-binding transcriptional LysR family regulator